MLRAGSEEPLAVLSNAKEGSLQLLDSKLPRFFAAAQNDSVREFFIILLEFSVLLKVLIGE